MKVAQPTSRVGLVTMAPSTPMKVSAPESPLPGLGKPARFPLKNISGLEPQPSTPTSAVLLRG